MGNKIYTEGSNVFIGDADKLHHETSQGICGGWQQTAKQGPKKGYKVDVRWRCSLQ